MKQIIYLCCLFPLLVQAQIQERNIYESAVEEVPENGYYNILLTQQLVGVSRDNRLHDIRMYDASGGEVPYFIRTEGVSQEIQQWLWYDLLENTGTDSINRIVLHNPEEKLIHRLLIVSRLADVNHSVQVRGSNDCSSWFIVKQFRHITKRTSDDQVHEIFTVDIPAGNYPYYEITIRNSGSSPLNITGVVNTEDQQIYYTLSPLPVFPVVQKDSSDRHTYLFFPDLPQDFRFDRVDFFLNHPSDYFRQATYAGGDRFTFNLSSGSDNRFYPQTMRLTRENYFRIDNQNSPPLKVDSVRFYGQDRYLCAYLTVAEKYKVVIDNQQRDRSTYDIEHFRNDIPSQLPVLQTTLPVVWHEQIEAVNRKTLWIERPIVLWSILIGVGLFLLWICWRVMKQTKH